MTLCNRGSAFAWLTRQVERRNVVRGKERVGEPQRVLHGAEGGLLVPARPNDEG